MPVPRLPDNFPPGTRFWLVTIEAFADAAADGCTQLLRADGTVIDGAAAERWRHRAAIEGIELTEAEFRKLAPPSLAEQRQAIEERAKRDPEFAKALRAALTDEDVKQCERIAWDALRNAPNLEEQREGAKLLLKIGARKQNIPDQ